MNLKLVVASMSVLGLVSCPVFADTMAKPKHHHKKMVKHHHVAHVETEAHPDYKEMGSLPAAPAPEVCTISQNAMIMDSMTQNLGRAMPNPCNPGWFNRIQVSGGLNFDGGKWGHHNTRYMGENYQHFSLNDAYLNVSAHVNDWAKGFVSISYNDATRRDSNFTTVVTGSTTTAYYGYRQAEYSAGYSNNAGQSGSNLNLEQGYVTIGNLDQLPVFLQVGKQFQDFGRYEIHPITRSITQSMSEILATSAKVGFIANGFNGSVYGFDDPTKKTGNSTTAFTTRSGKTTTNYGFALGYDNPSDCLGYDLGVGYINNLIGVNDIAYVVANNNLSNTYHRRVSGLAAYGDVNSGPFSVAVRYVTALQKFNRYDLNAGYYGTDIGTTGYHHHHDRNEPWSVGVTANYGFEAFDCRNNNIYVGYQGSRKAEGLELPKDRWLLGYNIDAWKWTNLGLEWDHDQSYKRHHHHNSDTNLVTIRAAVKFG